MRLILLVILLLSCTTKEDIPIVRFKVETCVLIDSYDIETWERNPIIKILNVGKRSYLVTYWEPITKIFTGQDKISFESLESRGFNIDCPDLE